MNTVVVVVVVVEIAVVIVKVVVETVGGIRTIDLAIMCRPFIVCGKTTAWLRKSTDPFPTNFDKVRQISDI